MTLLKNITIGVLALQGDYEAHKKQLEALDVKAVEVRLASDLKNLDALIIPGGESTTMDKLINRFDLRQPLISFCKCKPVFGTCAGMILLSKKIEDKGLIHYLLEEHNHNRYSDSRSLSACLYFQGLTCSISRGVS